jgi:hypothetical protein
MGGVSRKNCYCIFCPHYLYGDTYSDTWTV